MGSNPITPAPPGVAFNNGTHCAYNVTFEHTADDPAAYTVPEPFADVFQPVNAYPVRVGVTVDNTTVEPAVHD